MRVSKEWLEQYITLPKSITPNDLADTITIKSVEVEEVISCNELLLGMVLAKIVSIEKHPNADSLFCCKVDNGSKELLPIVCGGGNLREGMHVILGMIGARVRWHGEGGLVELQKTKIRGEESHGMICAAEEIGLELLFSQKDEKDIVDVSFLEGVELGTPISTALGIDDYVLDIENKSMTHRPDLWGHYGLARECSAIYDVPLKDIQHPDIVGGNTVEVSVEIKDPELCPRYMAVALENLDNKEAPLWMRKRLALAGARSINAIVDITNYVMLELGQPLHAFDITSLESPHIVVRRAKDKESITVLGGDDFSLTSEMLVIEDRKKAIALAGIKGGENTGVTEETTSILLEAANFNARSIRRTSSALGLRTDASARFEKNLDPLLAQKALQRAVALFVDIFPEAKVTSNVCDAQSFSIDKPVITVSQKQINTMLGCEVDESFVIETLTKLGFDVSVKKSTFSVVVPSHRSTGDISIPEDIIEEIARMYGYGNIPEVLPTFPITPSPTSPLRDTKKKVVELLSLVHGFSEQYSYAFVSPTWLERLQISSTQHIELANPLAKDRPLIRRSIVPNMLESVEKNFHRFDTVKLYELGPVFYAEKEGEFEDTSSKAKLPKQEEVLGLVYGAKNENTPFFMLRVTITHLLDQLGISGYTFEHKKTKESDSLEHPGRTAQVVVNGNCVAEISEIHPVVQKEIGIPYKTAFAELFLERLLQDVGEVLDYTPISPFPTSQRDIAFTVARKASHNNLKTTILEADALIVSVDLFDVYTGKERDKEEKSMAYHIVYGSKERTLTSEEVDASHKKVIAILEKKHGAKIRS
ncbi:MAG: phenylalanine--tRNA ligase subunit beta [Candidatus Magasanikbacteria bacterium]|nr:phenylalanine--tRNA ligase subunit beta [Candidatus Magasanikbacteria bacterium]